MRSNAAREGNRMERVIIFMGFVGFTDCPYTCSVSSAPIILWLGNGRDKVRSRTVMGYSPSRTVQGRNPRAVGVGTAGACRVGGAALAGVTGGVRSGR